MIPRPVIWVLLLAALAGALSYALYTRSPPESQAGQLLRNHPAYYAPWRFWFLNAEEREQALADFQAAVDAQTPGIVSNALETVRAGSPPARRRAQLVLTRVGSLTADQLQPLEASSDPEVWGFAALRGPSESLLYPRRGTSLPSPGRPETDLDGAAQDLQQRLSRLEITEPERLQSLDTVDLDSDGKDEAVARTYTVGANWHTSRLYVFARHAPDSPVLLESHDPAGRLRFLQKEPGGPILVAGASFICPIGLAGTVERRAGQPGLRWTLQRWTGRAFEPVGEVLTPFP